MLELRDITKSWGEVHALRGVSLDVPCGTIAGLVGADGAGKSTLFDIAATLVRQDDGTVVIDGMDSMRQWRALRRKVGYMPARFSLYGDLSVDENLRFFANIYRQPVSNVELISNIWEQIAPFGNRPAKALSGGMKQKLALCCTMIHNPSLLLLDEPTTGVDPTSRREFWEALRSLAKQGKTILVSTSYMDEAARCDHITMLESGRVIASVDPGRIAAEYVGRLYKVTMVGSAASRSEARQMLETLPEATCYTFGDELHLTLSGADGVLGRIGPDDIVAHLAQRGVEPTTVAVSSLMPSVEDLFIQRKIQQQSRV